MRWIVFVLSFLPFVGAAQDLCRKGLSTIDLWF